MSALGMGEQGTPASPPPQLGPHVCPASPFSSAWLWSPKKRLGPWVLFNYCISLSPGFGGGVKPQKPGETPLSIPGPLSVSPSAWLPLKPVCFSSLVFPLALSPQDMETGLELVPFQDWEPSQVSTPVAPSWGSGREKVRDRAGIRELEGERAGFLGKVGAQPHCLSSGLGGRLKL